MADYYLDPFGDIIVDINGDIIMAEGWDEIRHRIIRRIVTNPTFIDFNGQVVLAGYIYDPVYGIGLKYSVGAVFTDDLINQLKQKIIQGINTDTSVDTRYAVAVTVTRPSLRTLIAFAQFVLTDGLTQSLKFEFQN